MKHVPVVFSIQLLVVRVVVRKQEVRSAVIMFIFVSHPFKTTPDRSILLNSLSDFSRNKKKL